MLNNKYYFGSSGNGNASIECYWWCNEITKYTNTVFSNRKYNCSTELKLYFFTATAIVCIFFIVQMFKSSFKQTEISSYVTALQRAFGISVRYMFGIKTFNYTTNANVEMVWIVFRRISGFSTNFHGKRISMQFYSAYWNFPRKRFLFLDKWWADSILNAC